MSDGQWVFVAIVAAWPVLLFAGLWWLNRAFNRIIKRIEGKLK